VIDKASGEKVLLSDGDVVLNAPGAPCDWFSSHSIEPVSLPIDKKLRKITRINICGQAKHTNGADTLSLESIHSERKKLKLLHSTNTLNILCVVTNRSLGETVTQKNSHLTLSFSILAIINNTSGHSFPDGSTLLPGLLVNLPTINHLQHRHHHRETFRFYCSRHRCSLKCVL